jgi:predicted protein tyrosine phosphatase
MVKIEIEWLSNTRDVICIDVCKALYFMPKSLVFGRQTYHRRHPQKRLDVICVDVVQDFVFYTWFLVDSQTYHWHHPQKC